MVLHGNFVRKYVPNDYMEKSLNFAVTTNTKESNESQMLRSLSEEMISLKVHSTFMF